MKIEDLKPVAPPRSVLKYFKKEYVKHILRHSTTTVKTADITALWKKLNTEEREKIRLKFETSQCKYEKEYALYLSRLEPYLRRKKNRHNAIKPSIQNIDEEAVTTIGGNNETSSVNEIVDGDVGPLERCISENSPSHIEHIELQTREEQELIDRESINERFHVAVEKPVPPPKDPKSLFMMLQEDRMDFEESEDVWRVMSRPQKERYRSAVRTLKREYLKKYKEYLCSLTDLELADILREKRLIIPPQIND